MLSSELVMLNRDYQSLKIEHRHQQDLLSKSQKQLLEAQKQITLKDQSLEKLRRERDDLSALVS